MTEQYDNRQIHVHGEPVSGQRKVIQYRVDPTVTAYRLASFIWMLFGILIGVIGLRVLLKFIAANPANPFAALVYSVTDIFLWPFFGLTGTPSANGMVLEIPSIIAMLIYALLGWVFVKITWLLLDRP